jgi:hypothetical protein
VSLRLKNSCFSARYLRDIADRYDRIILEVLMCVMLYRRESAVVDEGKDLTSTSVWRFPSLYKHKFISVEVCCPGSLLACTRICTKEGNRVNMLLFHFMAFLSIAAFWLILQPLASDLINVVRL